MSDSPGALQCPDAKQPWREIGAALRSKGQNVFHREGKTQATVCCIYIPDNKRESSVGEEKISLDLGSLFGLNSSY